MKTRLLGGYGHARIAACVPVVTPGDPEANASAARAEIEKADARGIQLLAFPELSLTGYTCGDLFGQPILLEKCIEALASIRTFMQATGKFMVVIVGMPLVVEQKLFNVAVVLSGGKILAVVPKSHIPNYKEFYEARWFHPARALHTDTIELLGQRVPIGTDIIIEAEGDPGFKIGVDICEDIWMPYSPGSRLALHGATVLVNVSASNDLVGKADYRRLLVAGQSGRCIAAQLYVSAGIWESTSDVVFGGDAMIYVNGTKAAESKRFALEAQTIVTDVDISALERERMTTGTFGDASTLEQTPYRTVKCHIASFAEVYDFLRTIDPHPFVPKDPATLNARCEEIFAIQSTGLLRRLKSVFKEKNPDVYIGISGGLDSTLALLVTIQAYTAMGWDLKGIHAITMPGPGTTSRTYKNALALCKSLGIGVRRIGITKAVTGHLRDIGHKPCWQCLKCENAQARERTQILMDLGFTIGTGDLSEIALGWCTYNGDQNSMYNVNAGVPKTLVRHVIAWDANRRHGGDETRARLMDILDTPVSPELKKGGKQKTEEIIGPYELHDFFLIHMLRYGASPKKILFLAENAFRGTHDRETILKWMTVFYNRFFMAQFKRDAAPDGPKVGSVALSQRGDWRMPSDIEGNLWKKEVAELHRN